MHDHDLEVIAAVAEGTLDAESARSAETRINACDECRTELQAQRTALATLRAAAPPGLSEMESARLRRAVRAAVGLEEQPARSQRKLVPWAGLAAAAAALIALVIAGPLLGLLSTGGGEEIAELAVTSTQPERAEAAQEPAEAPVAPESPATTTPGARPAAPPAPAETGDGFAEELESAADQAAVAEEVPAAPSLQLGELQVGDLDELRQVFAAPGDGVTFYRSLTEEERLALERLAPDAAVATPEPDLADRADCTTVIPDLVPDATMIVVAAEATVDGRNAVLIAVFEETAPPILFALDIETCEVIAAAGE